MSQFYTQEDYRGTLLYLKPCDGRLSFYRKCHVENCGHYIVLYSYNTPVAKIDAGGAFMRLWDGYSATTMRHVNAFLHYVGYNVGGKKLWDALEVCKWYSYKELLRIYNKGGKK